MKIRALKFMLLNQRNKLNIQYSYLIHSFYLWNSNLSICKFKNRKIYNKLNSYFTF